jgi:hypothetical protein
LDVAGRARVGKIKSSEHFVGGFRLGQLAKGAIECEFEDTEGAEAARFSHAYSYVKEIAGSASAALRAGM